MSHKFQPGPRMEQCGALRLEAEALPQLLRCADQRLDSCLCFPRARSEHDPEIAAARVSNQASNHLAADLHRCGILPAEKNELNRRTNGEIVGTLHECADPREGGDSHGAAGDPGRQVHVVPHTGASFLLTGDHGQARCHGATQTMRAG